ncbi:MAG: DUF4870 domain-containing protein [Chloroflexi bacterium]|nr:DUF4870 domain-containing protein [Chloroflexota bacterium]
MNETSSFTPPAPLSESEERQWAMFAHLSILLNLVTGLLGVAAPLVIYMLYKDRSRYVAYHSLQSLVFQLIWWVGGGFVLGIVWAITGVLSSVIVGLLCIPLACILSLVPLGALGYGIYGGVEASQGRDFKYWLIGDWVRGTYTS